MVSVLLSHGVCMVLLVTMRCIVRMVVLFFMCGSRFSLYGMCWYRSEVVYFLGFVFYGLWMLVLQSY